MSRIAGEPYRPLYSPLNRKGHPTPNAAEAASKYSMSISLM
ncbi:hypothetical protein ACFLZ5_09780 [Thermodesulfobacteriota bacterium]